MDLLKGNGILLCVGTLIIVVSVSKMSVSFPFSDIFPLPGISSKHLKTDGVPSYWY